MKHLTEIRTIVSKNARKAERSRCLRIIDGAITNSQTLDPETPVTASGLIIILSRLRDAIHTGEDPLNKPPTEGAVG